MISFFHIRRTRFVNQDALQPSRHRRRENQGRTSPVEPVYIDSLVWGPENDMRPESWPIGLEAETGSMTADRQAGQGDSGRADCTKSNANTLTR